MKLTGTFVLLQLVHGNRWLNRNRLQGWVAKSEKSSTCSKWISRASSSKVIQLKCWTCNARNETLCDEEGDNRECNQGQGTGFLWPKFDFCLSLSSHSEKPNMKYAQQKCANDRALPLTLIWVVRPAGSHQTVLLIVFFNYQIFVQFNFWSRNKASASVWNESLDELSRSESLATTGFTLI